MTHQDDDSSTLGNDSSTRGDDSSMHDDNVENGDVSAMCGFMRIHTCRVVMGAWGAEAAARE